MEKKRNPYQWCQEAVSYVRFKPDRAAIQKELEAHLADSRTLLRSQGVEWMESERRAVEAMGDPKAVGLALDRAHSPWLGWLWEASRWVCGVLLFFALCSVLHADWWSSLREDLSRLGAPDALDQEIWLNPEIGVGGYFDFLGELSCPDALQAGAYTLTPERALCWEDAETGGRLLALGLNAETWRFWLEEPQFYDNLSAVDSNGITYSYDRSPRISSGTLAAGRLRSQHCITLTPLYGNPEWVEITCLSGGWTIRLDLWEVTS